MAAVLAGCSGGNDEGPSTLLDGTAAREVPVELEAGNRRAVLTSVMVVPVESIEPDSAPDACVHERLSGLQAEGSAVVRVGVSTESVTFREAGGRGVFGCSNAPGPRERGRWCGGAYGNLYSGRLRDPRLSIGCTTRERTQVGFAWVQPGENTRFIGVDQPDYLEVYEVAGGLPVRIATVSGVDVERSAATFDVSEHAADGRLLREYTLEAFVAG